MIEHSVFSVMAALIVEILFMLFSVALRADEMSEYEAYWLAGFLLINTWAPPGSYYCNHF